MKRLLTIFVIAGIWFGGCASTRYIRVEINDGEASFNALTQSFHIQAKEAIFWKGVSNDDSMQSPDGFFNDPTPTPIPNDAPASATTTSKPIFDWPVWDSYSPEAENMIMKFMDGTTWRFNGKKWEKVEETP